MRLWAVSVTESWHCADKQPCFKATVINFIASRCCSFVLLRVQQRCLQKNCNKWAVGTLNTGQSVAQEVEDELRKLFSTGQYFTAPHYIHFQLCFHQWTYLVNIPLGRPFTASCRLSIYSSDASTCSEDIKSPHLGYFSVAGAICAFYYITEWVQMRNESTY